MTKFDVFEELNLNQEPLLDITPQNKTEYNSCKFSQDTNTTLNIENLTVNMGGAPEKKQDSGGGFASLVIGGATATMLFAPASVATVATICPIVGCTILGGVVLAMAVDAFKR